MYKVKSPGKLLISEYKLKHVCANHQQSPQKSTKCQELEIDNKMENYSKIFENDLLKSQSAQDKTIPFE